MLSAFFLALAIAPLPAVAQAPAAAPPAAAFLPAGQTSRHILDIGDRKLAYTAHADTLRMVVGTTWIDLFYVAYTLDGADENRPITFLFNGGPGAASAYLHIGGVGPKVLNTSPRGEIDDGDISLVDNPDTWLADTDLVFVDPAGTGYSRAAKPADEWLFYGVKQDTDLASSFVRQYLDANDRRGSPLFLAGESYGGFRVTLVTRTLASRYNIETEGVVLVSPALELAFLHSPFYDPLAWALRLPSFAAVELEHRGVSDSHTLAARLADVERFALSDYLIALASGMTAGGTTIRDRVTEITGLSPVVVASRFGRISSSVFVKEYLRSEQRVLSLYDGAVSAPDRYPSSRWRTGPDPVLDQTADEFTGAIVRYLCADLGYCMQSSYRLLNRDAGRRWDYGTSATRQGFAGVINDLQSAREDNPELEVLIAHGFTDLVTPYLTARYLVGQLPPLARARPVELANYAGGHMMYMRPASRAELLLDTRAMIARALDPRSVPADSSEAAPALP